ncbi:hypothetical protein EOT10_36795 [Streptomyces antnestii]|uniref:NADP-dependent oxidoreductase domain-containing protein n=1 Tax=Streptomyces antnestii TaxID=2494256 RepID=A0A437P1S5_9ACTN|nr:hypothetical protein EOT10_36795 [Streptomyces sp. San01]
MTSSLPGGTIRIAGKTVSRLGLGTMRLTGAGTWGDPDDRGQGLGVLRQAVHTYGITHIDTADAYGPHTVEELIAEALHPYPDETPRRDQGRPPAAGAQRVGPTRASGLPAGVCRGEPAPSEGRTAGAVPCKAAHRLRGVLFSLADPLGQ